MPAPCIIGCAASTIRCSASRINPRPISVRPTWPARVCLRDRKSGTPNRIRMGDNHERSSVRTRAISDVPRRRAMASPLVSGNSPGRERHEDDRGRVAALYETRHADAGQERAPAVARAALSTPRRSAPSTRRMPVRTICEPHTSSATPARRLRRINTRHCALGLCCRNRNPCCARIRGV